MAVVALALMMILTLPVVMTAVVLTIQVILAVLMTIPAMTILVTAVQIIAQGPMNTKRVANSPVHMKTVTAPLVAVLYVPLTELS